ncbi:MAG: sigma-70 family RNA polymerase sigma factor [Balneolales bacterium]
MTRSRIHNGSAFNDCCDPLVWKALRNGEIDGLKILYNRYHSSLYLYAEKFCGSPDMAEDHVQNLFLRIWEKRNSLAEVTGVKTYLWTALRRSLITTLNKNQRENIYQEEVFDNLPDMNFNAEELLTQRELDDQNKDELMNAFGQLSKRQREVIFLKFYEGMTYEEIEQIMQVSSQTSRNYVCEALKTLKFILSGKAVKPRSKHTG